MLDLGLQPANDAFPRPADPPPALHPLRLWRCGRCALVQLPDRSPVPEEPRAQEPEALRQHARESVAWARSSGLLRAGATVREFDSPHGGSWLPPLEAAGLRPAAGSTADVVVDAFGLIHEEDQRRGLTARVEALTGGGVLLVVLPPLETLVARGQWNAVRHGHHAYPSTAVLAEQLGELGLTVVATTLHPLYGGTRLLAAGGGALPAAVLPPDVSEEELDGLAVRVVESSRALRRYLEQQREAGRRVLGYGAASRAVPLLQVSGVGPELLPAVGDASPAKHGRLLPGSGIPVVPPSELVEARPDEVLLLLPDLLAEVRAALPQVEAGGGRWVPVDTIVR